MTDSYTYEAFGNLLSDGGATPNPYQYVGSLGYYTTGAPSLLHLGARYYVPGIGRFTSPDPLGEKNGSVYTYVSSNPISGVDASGLRSRRSRAVEDALDMLEPALHAGDFQWLVKCLEEAACKKNRGVARCKQDYETCLGAAWNRSGMNNPLWPVKYPLAPVDYAFSGLHCSVAYQACLARVYAVYSSDVFTCYGVYFGLGAFQYYLP